MDLNPPQHDDHCIFNIDYRPWRVVRLAGYELFLADADLTVCCIDIRNHDWNAYAHAVHVSWRRDEAMQDEQEARRRKRAEWDAKKKERLAKSRATRALNLTSHWAERKRRLGVARRQFKQKCSEPYRPFELQCLLRGNEEHWASWLAAISESHAPHD